MREKFSQCTLKLAVLSNFYARKNGYETILFTDATTYELLKNIPYSHVNIFKQSQMRFPKQFWCGPKFISMMEMTEPYLHIDMDLFLLSPDLPDKMKNKDFIYFHDEPWLDWSSFSAIIQDMFASSVNPLIPFSNMQFQSMNMAMFGATTEFGIQNIKNNASLLLDFVENNSSMFNVASSPSFFEVFDLYGFVDYYTYEFMICVILEQMFFANTLTKNLDPQMVLSLFGKIKKPDLLSFKYFLKNKNLFNKHKIYHVWGDKEKFMPIADKLIAHFNLNI
jgi:hypothetical protein